MLKGVDKRVTGELLHILCDMGHGDEVVIVDANYPAVTMGKKIISYPGMSATEVLEIVLELIPLDYIEEEAAVVLGMEAKDMEEGMERPQIWTDFNLILHSKSGTNVNMGEIPRQQFYDRSRNASVIIQTGEQKLYGDILLVKGIF